jgi:hypothetical protein
LAQVSKTKTTDFEALNLYSEVQLKNVIKAIEIYECSHQEFKNLKSLVKLPMLMTIFSSAIIGSLYISFLKGWSTQVVMKGGFLMFSTYVYWAIAGIGAILQLYLVNQAMINYNQAEIGPINESSLILLNLVCGGVILNEQKKYIWWELMLLLSSAAITIVGIYTFIAKPKFGNQKEKVNQLIGTTYNQISNDVETSSESTIIMTFMAQLSRYPFKDRE